MLKKLTIALLAALPALALAYSDAPTDSLIKPAAPKNDQGFGISMAVASGHLVIGAPYDTNSAGAIFTSQQGGTSYYAPTAARFEPPTKSGVQHMGGALTSDAYLVVSSMASASSNKGAVYLYARNGTSLSSAVALARPSSVTYTRFGDHMGMLQSGALYVGTATGYGFFYNKASNTTFGSPTVIDLRSQCSGSGDTFQLSSVTTDGSKFYIGVPRCTVGGKSDAGKVLVIDAYSPTAAPQVITASTPATGDLFGISLAISGNYMAVGASGNSTKGAAAGAVYAFTKKGSAFTQDFKIVPDDLVEGDGFGRAVAVNGKIIIAGAPLSDKKANDAGLLYMFKNGVLASADGTVPAVPPALIGTYSFDTVGAGHRLGWQILLSPDKSEMIVSAPYYKTAASAGGAVFASSIADSNGDGIPDGYNPASFDADGDGCPDDADAFPLDSSECKDSDGDGTGDNADGAPNSACDIKDSDGDGVGDKCDAFPFDAREFEDKDGDGHGDRYDDKFPNDPQEWEDADGDGYGDHLADKFPRDSREWSDRDGDGYGDNHADRFPDDPSEWADSDGDGIGDNADKFPNDPSEWADSDGDGHGNNSDAFPNNASEWQDSDGDGIGDNGDAFPNNANESVDSDGDGVGDNSDPYPHQPAQQTGVLDPLRPYTGTPQGPSGDPVNEAGYLYGNALINSGNALTNSQSLEDVYAATGVTSTQLNYATQQVLGFGFPAPAAPRCANYVEKASASGCR